MVKQFTQSPAVQAGVVYAFGGLAFALGSLLLARAYSPEEFAAIALILAVSQLAQTLGPVGANTIINRNTVDPSFYLLRYVSLSSAGVGILTALVAWGLYDISVPLSLLTAVICVASGINLVGSAFFRSRGRFAMALGLTQGHNAVLAFAAVVVVLLSSTSLVLPLAIIAGAYVISSLVGWFGAFDLERRVDAISVAEFPWHEGRTIIATTIAVIFLLQLERLSIPKLLDREALATFAVLAAVAGSPFRVLQMGVGYTLVPRLRNASSGEEIHRIIRSESTVAAVLAISACIVVWLITQPFVDWFLQGKYEISKLMMVAAMVSGLGKVLASFGSAGVTALGTGQDLSRLRTGSWIAVCVALIGAAAGAKFGLAGLLFGISVGWVFNASWSLALSRSVLAAAER
jgi:O-antigen/teichoic acid export membrane protein